MGIDWQTVKMLILNIFVGVSNWFLAYQEYKIVLLFYILKCEGVPQGQKLIGQMLELIKPMKSSVDLGIKPEEREVTKNGENFCWLDMFRLPADV